MSSPQMFLLMKRGAYYRRGACGYTFRKSEAGRYTEGEARVYAPDPVYGVTVIPEADAPELSPSATMEARADYWCEVGRNALAAAAALADAVAEMMKVDGCAGRDSYRFYEYCDAREKAASAIRVVRLKLAEPHPSPKGGPGAH